MMRRWAVLAVLAAPGGLVACSQPGERPSETSLPSVSVSVSTTVVPRVGHGSLAECLSEHGVPTAPGPTANPPSGVDPATWEKAMAECSSLAPGPAGE